MHSLQTEIEQGNAHRRLMKSFQMYNNQARDP